MYIDSLEDSTGVFTWLCTAGHLDHNTGFGMIERPMACDSLVCTAGGHYGNLMAPGGANSWPQERDLSTR
jgi:hypothetical protein